MDAGVAAIDIETKRMKEEMKLKDAQAKAIAEHGELALITVDGPQTVTQERITLRPPMLQVKSYSLYLYVNSVVTILFYLFILAYLDLMVHILEHYGKDFLLTLRY